MFEIREKKCPIVPNCINRIKWRVPWSAHSGGSRGGRYSTY